MRENNGSMSLQEFEAKLLGALVMQSIPAHMQINSSAAKALVSGTKEPLNLDKGLKEGEGRHNECVRKAGILIARKHTEQEALEALLKWNQLNNPSLPKDEVEKALAHAVTKEAAKPKNPFPYGYSMRSDGLYWDNLDHDNPIPIHISSPFEIVAETRDAQGMSWGILLRWFDADGVLHEWAMPRSMLAGDATDVRAELMSGGWYIAPGTKARNLFTSFLTAYRTHVRVRCVERAGWHGKMFVTAARTYGDTGAESVVLQTGTILQECKIVGSLEGWKREVAARAVGNSRLTFAISTAFAGPLLNLMGEESGGVHIVGASSIGKTTALYASMSAWGAGVDSWRTTDNAAENLASRACDSLLALDEIGQADARCVEALSYLLANGQGKKRMKREGGARKDTRWRVIVLSTGEIGSAEKLSDINRKAHAGQSVRLLEIPADAGAGHGMFENLHGEASGDHFSRRLKDACEQHSGHAAPIFLECITADPEKAASEAKAFVKQWMAEYLPAQADGQVHRAAGRFALIAAAGELAAAYGILPWPQGEAMRAAGVCFQTWLARRGGTGSAELMNGIARVREFLEAHGSSRFETIHISGNMSGSPAANALAAIPKPFATPLEDETIHDSGRIYNRAGFRKKNAVGLWEYHILPEVWRMEVCKGYDASAITKALKAQGSLITDNNRNDHSLRVPGHGPTKVYSIAASFFSDGNTENAGDAGDSGDDHIIQ